MVCPRLGRRRVLIPILLAMSATGILTAVMPSYASFIAARVLNAFIVIAIYETAFTYLLELVGGPYSTVVGVGAEAASTHFLQMAPMGAKVATS